MANLEFFDIDTPAALANLFKRYERYSEFSFYEVIDYGLTAHENESMQQWRVRMRKKRIRENIAQLKGNTFGQGIPVVRRRWFRKEKNYELDRAVKACIRVAGSRNVLKNIFGEQWII